MITEIQTRRFNVGDILKASWHLYRSQFLKIVAMTLCVVLPAQTIIILFPWDEINPTLSGFRTPLTANNLKLFLYYFFSYVPYLLYLASLTHLFERTVHEEDINWESAISSGLSDSGSVILTVILTTLLINVLTWLMIVPGIIFGTYYSFYFHAAVLRNCNIKAALKYSKNLVVGQWWRVFGMWLILIMIPWIVLYPYTLLGRLFSDIPIIRVIFYFFKAILLAFPVAESVVFFLNLDYLHHLSPENAQPALAPTPPARTLTIPE